MNSKLLLFTLVLCSFCFGVFSQVVPQGSLSGNAICPGGLPTLTFTATAGTGPFTVRYTDGNAIRTQTGVTSGIPFNAVSTTTATKTYTLLKVTGSDAGTRSSGFTEARGTVTVSARPDLKSLTLAPIAPVCAGSNATLSLSGFVQNQSFPSRPSISTSVNNAWSVYSADLDSDGDLDVLSVSVNDAKIVWYKNDGSGGFTEQTAISTSANGARSVYAADLDGDGDLDVLSASADDDKIAWYKNNGSGGFTEQTAISTSANGARSVYSADLDDDGDMDVLSACQDDDKIAWYKNDGSGGFTEQTAISTSANGAYSVYAADLDSDGDMDVLSASAFDAKIAWYKNDGSGGFTEQTAISTSANNARSVYAADLDGDGDMDVLSASSLDNKIAWYKNNGSGGFTPQTAISLSANVAWSVYAADLDGDGDMDVLSASVNDNKIAWYKNDGSGGFTAQTPISTSAIGARSVYAADLDGDGDMDVLSASYFDNKIAWYENRTPFSGNATITYTAGGGEPQTATSAVSMGMATFVLPAPKAGTLTLLKVGNTNGCTAGVSKTTPLRHLPRPDLKDLTLSPIAPVCVGSNATLALSGFVQNQSFQTHPPLSTSASFTTSVYAADLDGDGDIDVLSTSVNNDKIAWYKNDGSGGFTEQTAISTLADGAWSVYAADLDGDGDMDVLSASQDDDKIAWYKNDGSGVFTTQPAISTSANGAVSVYAADLDGDGDMDVLSASVNDDKIAWYKNDGSGSFTEQPAISTSADVAFSVYAADLDGDGDLDVLSASRSDNKIAWYKNDGNGVFTTQPVISTSANGAFSVYAADLDGDGDQDVLSASYRDNKIAWYKNDGSGGFVEQTAISTSASAAFSVYAADMDGDGDLDVLSASTSDNKIAWYKNDGIGGFTEQTPISTSANGAWSVYSADLDGDGDLDVLSASQYDNKIMWYENRTPFSGNASVSYKINSGSPQTTPITVSSGSASAVIASPVSGTLQLSKISATNGCETAVTTATSLSVDLASVGGTVSSAQTICTGTSPANLTLSGQVGNVLKWQKASDAAFSSPVDIASTSTTLTSALMGTLTADTYFRAVVKSGVCNEANSSAVLISVNPLPTATISGTTTVCGNGTSPNVTFTGTNGTVPYTFTYKINDGALQTVTTTSGNSVTVSVPTGTAGTFVYSLVSVSESSAATCSQSQSGSATVTVNPLPTATISGTTTVCRNGTSPNVTLTGANGTAPYTFTYKINDGSSQTVTTTSGNSVTVSVPTGTAGTFVYSLVSVSESSVATCSQSQSGSATVTVNPLPTATISGMTAVCQNSPSSSITFTGANAIAPYTFTYKINDGAPQTVKTVSGNSVTVSVPTSVIGVFTYTLVSVIESSSSSCSQLQSGSVEIKIQSKPTITLTTLQQTLNEGNSQTFCDIDSNPVNNVQFTVTTGCVVGAPVWRVQVGSGAWSDWSPNAPVSQSSNNQPHRYQAACDASCPVTYTNPIEVKINYRASTPQQVSLVADGVTVKEGESKEVCNIEGNALVFNATCASGEIVLYSVDGGDYSGVIPTQLVDGQFHNYRVRCRKSDGTPSCIESESGAMRLKITNGLGQVPVASLNLTSGCGTPVAFSGTASCGSLTTVWYNALTNVALPTLPSQTPTETMSYYARCQAGGGCLSEKSNVVTYTVIPVGLAPVVSVSSEVVCAGTMVTISANCPSGSTTSWNTGVTTPSFEVSFNNVTKQTYWAKCVFAGGCQSAESVKKEVYWSAFVVTLINVGQTKSAVKPANDKALWSSQFIGKDGGLELAQSTQSNPTLYYVENVNKVAPRYWTINVDACGLGTDGSLTFDLLATPETGVPQSFNTHENNAPYFMYANRDGWTELYAQNHPAYGFYQDNGAGGNAYDSGLPKGLYKLGIRYWDQKGWGSIYPSTRKPQGNVLAYQEYWFRIQSKDGIGVGAARVADSGQQGPDRRTVNDLPPNVFAQVMPNPVSSVLRLQVQGGKGEEVQTTLMDASGRSVLRRQFVPETNTHQEEFGVGELPTGIYFLQVVRAEKQTVLKVVKVE